MRVQASIYVNIIIINAVYTANTDRCLADMDLRSYCCCGKSTETIATLNCPQNFNLKRLIITRESLKRLCGYAIDSPGRYLDDQVCNVTGEYYG